MNKPKWTPKWTRGEWRAQNNSVMNEHGEIITCCVIGSVDRGDSTEDYQTAMLLSAAKDIYHALEAYRRMTDAPPAIEKQADAALAKARGVKQ